jgi:hypothetical protein
MKMLNMITGIIKDYTKEDIQNREKLVNTDIREVFIGQKMQEFCHRMIHPAGNIWIRSMGHKKFKVTLKPLKLNSGLARCLNCNRL